MGNLPDHVPPRRARRSRRSVEADGALGRLAAGGQRRARRRARPQSCRYFIAVRTTGSAVELLVRLFSLPIRPGTLLTPARSNSPR